MRTITRAGLVAAIGLTAAFGAAAPAFAQSYPLPVSATIQSAISLTGLTPITFPATVPGSPVTFAENYTAASNDSAGFNVTVADTGTPAGLTGTGGTIPDADIKVSSNLGQANVALTTAAASVYSPSGGTGQALIDTWTLTIPSAAALPAGTYTGQITYVITGK